jgi:hypothetical protein
VRDDLLLQLGGGETELDGHHPLPRRILQILQHALIPGVVGHHQAEAGRRVERHPQALDRQLAAMVGERMQHHRGVLPGLDHLVQIADRTLANRAGQRAVHPHRLVTLQQISADQVRGGQVVMAGDGDQGATELVRHRLDEPGLTAPGRALQDQR